LYVKGGYSSQKVLLGGVFVVHREGRQAIRVYYAPKGFRGVGRASIHPDNYGGRGFVALYVVGNAGGAIKENRFPSEAQNYGRHDGGLATAIGTGQNVQVVLRMECDLAVGSVVGNNQMSREIVNLRL